MTFPSGRVSGGRVMLGGERFAKCIAWVVMVTGNAALGLTIADPHTHATTAGWLAFSAGSLGWVSFFTWLLLLGGVND